MSISISYSLCPSITSWNIQVFHEIIFFKFQVRIFQQKVRKNFFSPFDKTYYFLVLKEGIHPGCKHSLKYCIDVYRACIIMNTRFAVLTCFFSKKNIFFLLLFSERLFPKTVWISYFSSKTNLNVKFNISDTHLMNTKIDRLVVIEKMNLNEAFQSEFVQMTKKSFKIFIFVLVNLHYLTNITRQKKLIHLTIT